MCRTLCVVALLTLQAGWAHCFSWDIVVAAGNRLEFYNEDKVTYSVTFTDVDVRWITYDPFHNRVLFANLTSRSLLSFDIATRKSQNLFDLKPVHRSPHFFYDPATGLFLAVSSCEVYSYLLKPGSNHEVDTNFIIDLGNACDCIAVDSCGGYIYWSGSSNEIKRARLNGSGREEVIETSDNYRFSLIIDPQTQNMYWMEIDYFTVQYLILSADLNGKHRRTLYKFDLEHYYNLYLTVSNDFIYWVRSFEDESFWKIPKNLPLALGTDVEPKQFTFKDSCCHHRYISANYAIEEQPQGIPRCKALKPLLPNYQENNDSDSLNFSTGGSLLRVNETKVSGESWVSGDTLNVPVCYNYCLQGNCSVNADGQPKCRCNVGYSGVRCEVNACQTYCLHGGVCSLSEQNNPVCQCTGDYQGERCDVPAFLIKCSQQTVSLLKDADLTSVTEGKEVKSTSSTVD